MDKIKILTYGSLRKGEYNFESFQYMFGEENFRYISTTTVKGFDLFDLGSYPGINYSEDPNKTLVVDIMECSKECADAIKRMELGAGYSQELVVTENTEEILPIYIYNYKQGSLVESGDWSKHLQLN